MADTIDSLVLQSGGKHHIVRLTNVSDATGESGVVKVDVSTLLNANGKVPTKTRVKEIAWSTGGFTSIRLFWDADTDDEIVVLSGSGYLDLHAVGGLKDPFTAGATGDIKLTTAGAISGATYNIILVVELI